MEVPLQTALDDIEELLLQIAVHARRPFFSLWNRLNQSEDTADLSLNQKLLKILPHLEGLKRVSLPPDIQFLSWVNPRYPSVLRELKQPPLGLFVWGSWISQEKRAGVVGSRKPVSFALRMTGDFVMRVVEKDYAIVSGGAFGIDIEAHRICLESNGKAICVLGSGLRHLYPKANERLMLQMVEKGGVLVSEYPPLSPPAPWTFPERNRLIAALSDFLVMAQAGEKSGSLSTARAALDLGREVFVLRPVPLDAGFDGSRALIDSGAQILTSPQQLN